MYIYIDYAHIMYRFIYISIHVNRTIDPAVSWDIKWAQVAVRCAAAASLQVHPRCLAVRWKNPPGTRKKTRNNRKTKGKLWENHGFSMGFCGMYPKWY